MPLQFSKNIAFTKVIKASGRPREFNFRRKKKGDDFEYDIDVSDERGNRHYFSMHKEEGRWAVREKLLPAWIAEALPELPAAIEETERTMT